MQPELLWGRAKGEIGEVESVEVVKSLFYRLLSLAKSGSISCRDVFGIGGSPFDLNADGAGAAG